MASLTNDNYSYLRDSTSFRSLSGQKIFREKEIDLVIYGVSEWFLSQMIIIPVCETVPHLDP